MDNSVPVRSFESRADFDSAFQNLFDGQRTLAQPIGQCLAFEIFHDEKTDPILLADVIEMADIGMTQRRNSARFPIEVGAGQTVNGAIYTSPWAFTSIGSPTTGGTIDFLDTKAVVCANCHTTMNHIAPLFANFDGTGQLTGAIAVHTPADGSPLATMADWLPAGETTAWRFGVAAPDLPALGAAMAADRDVATCGVARVWNFALGKGDIVDTIAVVPPTVIQAQVDAFAAGGGKLKDAMYAVFTSDDFVKF